VASNTPKQPEKISADCPHCGFSQLESAIAKSTFCRKCGEHYSIEKLLLKETTSLKGPSIFDKFSKMLSREKIRDVVCFSCAARQQVSTQAQSTQCAHCSSYLDLRDFKIAGPFGRSIQTQGEVIITSKGDVTSARIACANALVEGKMRGQLICTDTATIRIKGKYLGAIDVNRLHVHKKSEVEFVRPVKMITAEINGRCSARIMCEGQVLINKGGVLDGVVYAKAITVEKGGIFTGELYIGQQELAQADLLEAVAEPDDLFGGDAVSFGPA
jgi:cytoskeletal protein CcmA (bactofilin family)